MKRIYQSYKFLDIIKSLKAHKPRKIEKFHSNGSSFIKFSRTLDIYLETLDVKSKIDKYTCNSHHEPLKLINNSSQYSSRILIVLQLIQMIHLIIDQSLQLSPPLLPLRSNKDIKDINFNTTI